MYDLIIIGAGPAGITAAVYAARKRLNILVISEDIGGQAAWSGDIENYTGYQFISGPDLALKFEEHMRKYEIKLCERERALEINKQGNIIEVKTNKNSYSAKSIIIASGKRSRELKVPGEKEFKNKGLTYCATCDGPLFAGKDVVIIGGGNSALDAALQLIKIARKVYIINHNADLAGDEVMREKVMNANNVTIFNNSQVTEIIGDNFVKAIKFNKEGQEQTIAVQGIFVEIGLMPNSDFSPLINKNEKGEIKVTSRNETNILGIFAAGDVTDVPEKQIIIAAGEGSKAALSVFRYLAKNKF